MIPQTQSRTGKDGRCFEACLASILEIPEDEVPDFGDGDHFLRNTQSFLADWNLFYVQVPPDSPGVDEAFSSKGAKVFHTIEGRSPRGGLHAIVGLNGQPKWDPHPLDGTGRGLVSVECFGLLCSLL